MKKNNPPYTIPITHAVQDYADATTYYFCNKPASSAATGANDRNGVIARTGVIRGVAIVFNIGTGGTTENCPYYVRINNTTDYLIGNAVLNTNLNTLINNNMNIAVTAGDKVQIKIITPTWATNPLQVCPNGHIMVV